MAEAGIEPSVLVTVTTMLSQRLSTDRFDGSVSWRAYMKTPWTRINCQIPRPRVWTRKWPWSRISWAMSSVWILALS